MRASEFLLWAGQVAVTTIAANESQIKRTMSEHDPKGEKIQEFHAHQGCISSCSLIHNNSTIVTASHDTKIILWGGPSLYYCLLEPDPYTGGEGLAGDLQDNWNSALTGRRLHELCGHHHAVVDCRVPLEEGGEDRLLSASWDKTARLWDIHSGIQQWLGSHESLATSCDFCTAQPSSSAAVVIIGLEDGTYCTWDTRVNKPVKTVKAHANTITCCRVSPNGHNVCTCSMDQTAAVWDIRTNSRLLNLSDHVNIISSCAFSYNSHFLVTGSWDKTLLVYDVAIGTYRACGPVALLQHDGCVSACDFSKDGSLLVSSGYDMQVNLWNMNNYQLKNSYKGHEAWIKDVEFGENKKWAVSCDKSGVVRVWNTETGSQHYNKMVKQKDPNTVELIQCSKCEKMFSPAYSSSQNLSTTVAAAQSAEGGGGKGEINTDKSDGGNLPVIRGISSARQQQQQLCVFCRLRDPSRRFSVDDYS